MENNISWLLISDASKARIFAVRKAALFNEPNNTKHLQLVGEYTHEDSRKKGSELNADRLGEFGTGTFVEATSPKTREAEQFALELVSYLEAGRKSHSFKEFILIAPPAFMGLIKKHIHHELHKQLGKTIEKDYTQLNNQELLKTIVNQL